MKHRLLSCCLAALLLSPVAARAGVQHLIPKPAEMTVDVNGVVLLPENITIATESGLSPAMLVEVDSMAATLRSYTNSKVKIKKGRKGFVRVTADANLPAEGYTLNITSAGVDIAAEAPAGLFYAFQTLRKLLPSGVMAGVAPAPGERFPLPLVSINDKPRYEYRGFMLDVSRHFFTVEEIKKMLDLMGMYKMNRFHWHLTDDQGWRLPMAKYPNLTMAGATNRNILRSDFRENKQWRDGDDVVYGPFAYTEDEIRDVVNYARERHIEVIPEVDMPGHMVAAIHAYPQFSTDPENKNNVHPDLDHQIWNKAGVSRDALDISNPEVMTFVRDVIDVLADLFPYEYIHIGGDECETLAWEKSPACQQFMHDHGLTNERQIQSWFTREVANYAREEHGRKIIGWNEVITQPGTDMEMIKQINPVIFCWLGGEQLAEASGLKHVYTPFWHGYYINRSYKGVNTIGAGQDGSLRQTIETNPPAHDNCIGVQGTFWTEQVDSPSDMEWLALPRLIGIAEHGWSVDTVKSFPEFRARLQADLPVLDARGYSYGPLNNQ